MRIPTFVLGTFAIITLTALAAAAAPQAQQPDRSLPGQNQPQAEALRSVQGDLLSVDTKAMTLMIRTADATMQFRYTNDTEITGALETIAGLATAKDVRVTVRFIEEGQIRTATRIDVQPIRK
jgi:hypothetical protein